MEVKRVEQAARGRGRRSCGRLMQECSHCFNALSGCSSSFRRDCPPPGVREVGNLQCAPIREKLLRYAPVDDVAAAKGCAMLFIAAEHEELFSNQEHPGAGL